MQTPTLCRWRHLFRQILWGKWRWLSAIISEPQDLTNLFDHLGTLSFWNNRSLFWRHMVVWDGKTSHCSSQIWTSQDSPEVTQWPGCLSWFGHTGGGPAAVFGKQYGDKENSLKLVFGDISATLLHKYYPYWLTLLSANSEKGSCGGNLSKCTQGHNAGRRHVSQRVGWTYSRMKSLHLFAEWEGHIQPRVTDSPVLNSFCAVLGGGSGVGGQLAPSEGVCSHRSRPGAVDRWANHTCIGSAKSFDVLVYCRLYLEAWRQICGSTRERFFA